MSERVPIDYSLVIMGTIALTIIKTTQTIKSIVTFPIKCITDPIKNKAVKKKIEEGGFRKEQWLELSQRLEKKARKQQFVYVFIKAVNFDQNNEKKEDIIMAMGLPKDHEVKRILQVLRRQLSYLKDQSTQLFCNNKMVNMKARLESLPLNDLGIAELYIVNMDIWMICFSPFLRSSLLFSLLNMLDKFKKEVGFIKQSSSKKDMRRLQPSHSDSSDSFSSFEYDAHRERQEEFSPYRHPVAEGIGLQAQSKEAKRKAYPNKESNSPPKFSNQILRNNFIREFNENSNQANIEKRPEKTQKVKSRDQPVQSRKDQNRLESKGQAGTEDFEEELSLSNIHKFQKSKEPQRVEVEPENKLTKQFPKPIKYIEQYSSSSEQESDGLEALQKKQTFKQPKQKKKALPKRQDEEELITEYDKRQFKDKSIKRAILEQDMQKPRQKGAYQTKGGICFELDTRQFKGPSKGNQLPKKKKKKVQVDERLTLLQRREMAKMYDRQARSRVFGYY